LLEGQSASGAFRSTVHVGARTLLDWNGFTTAQVLRALDGIADTGPLVDARARALDFLVRCESPSRPGAFGFWPCDRQPGWINTLPPDADDTSVIALELARHGRLDRSQVRRIACTVLIPNRLRGVEGPAPPWLRPGVFLTWVRHGQHRNVVDCCVNANVVAVLACAGLEHLPGFQEARTMIEDGIRWAGLSRVRARCLTPFYPHPGELLHAVRHAVCCGAVQLEPSLRLLHALPWAVEAETDILVPGRPICGSAYGQIVWTSDVLQIARWLRRDRRAGQHAKSPAGNDARPG
jgi:hypothetical protein